MNPYRADRWCYLTYFAKIPESISWIDPCAWQRELWLVLTEYECNEAFYTNRWSYSTTWARSERNLKDEHFTPDDVACFFFLVTSPPLAAGWRCLLLFSTWGLVYIPKTSHRMFGHMYEILNKIYLQNFLHGWVVNRKMNLMSILNPWFATVILWIN